MKKQLTTKRFTATLLEGHKEAAFEVPFDPEKEWDMKAQQLWRGRRGHHVHGIVKGIAFKSVIVPRSRHFYVLIHDDLRKNAKLSIGDVATLTLKITPLPKKH